MVSRHTRAHCESMSRSDRHFRASEPAFGLLGRFRANVLDHDRCRSASRVHPSRDSDLLRREGHKLRILSRRRRCVGDWPINCPIIRQNYQRRSRSRACLRALLADWLLQVLRKRTRRIQHISLNRCRFSRVACCQRHQQQYARCHAHSVDAQGASFLSGIQNERYASRPSVFDNSQNRVSNRSRAPCPVLSQLSTVPVSPSRSPNYHFLSPPQIW